MIVNSILQNDLYKFTMQQAVFHQYPNVQVSYSFKCRNEDVKLGYLSESIKEEIKKMERLSLSNEEYDYLDSLKIFRKDYLDYLKSYKFQSNEVDVFSHDGELFIDIHFKSWLSSILWEVPVLYIVNELYFKDKIPQSTCVGMRNLDEKIDLVKQFPQFRFADFGTRRRFSCKWHEKVISKLVKEIDYNIVGTSNVYFAKKFNIRPIGTMAHEYIMAHIGLTNRIEEAQKRAFHVWLQEYDNDLGIALTDTFTTDAFFKDFNTVLSNGYDGVRHDSGCPYLFAENVITHYENLDINPKTKTIVFSDGLDFPKAIDLWKRFVGRIGVSFGIGTNLTNDVGFKPLNIVMKMTNCNNIPVVKLSDNSGKTIGDKNIVNKIREVYSLS